MMMMMAAAAWTTVAAGKRGGDIYVKCAASSLASPGPAEASPVTGSGFGNNSQESLDALADYNGWRDSLCQ